MLAEFTQYLATTCSLTVGTNLFCGYLPSDAQDECSVVMDAGGAAEPYITTDEEHVISIWTRDRDYLPGLNRARVIFEALRQSVDVTLPTVDTDTYTALEILAITPPQYLGLGERKHHTFSAKYRVVTRKD